MYSKENWFSQLRLPLCQGPGRLPQSKPRKGTSCHSPPRDRITQNLCYNFPLVGFPKQLMPEVFQAYVNHNKRQTFQQSHVVFLSKCPKVFNTHSHRERGKRGTPQWLTCVPPKVTGANTHMCTRTHTRPHTRVVVGKSERGLPEGGCGNTDQRDPRVGHP